LLSSWPPLTFALHRHRQTGAEERGLATSRRPDDPERTGADEASGEFSHEPLATEEVVGVDRLEALQTLERARSLDRDGGWRAQTRENPRLLADELEVDRLARQLGLDLAQVASADGGPRGDVHQAAACSSTATDSAACPNSRQLG
jgi:hypothetical protein